MISEAINGGNVEKRILSIISQIHSSGPIDLATLEELSIIKLYHGDQLKQYESRLMGVMGLFYKTAKPSSVIEYVYETYADAIKDELGDLFTPVQASIYREIISKRYISFSAPTSAGKSHLFRQIIVSADYDIVIVVPSRALISEYVSRVEKIVGNDVLVLPFIDDINRARTSRRVFIITPERGADLFGKMKKFNVGLFLLDEAQISEDGLRGLRFDAFVRRIDRELPSARKVFAHPFVKNPSAQLSKHGFENDSFAKSYEQHAVGKVFLSHNFGRFEIFSVATGSESVSLKTDPVEKVLHSGGTVLIYISKGKIYQRKFLNQFSSYLDTCQPVRNERALSLISSLKEYIGGTSEGGEKHSLFIQMIERGVVLHHGSIPLRARSVVEMFVREGFARICFATSTLNQGINMPFDVVWIDNFTRMDPLTLKNLIGRSGRTTDAVGDFDFGYTVVNKKNLITFKKRMNEEYELSETSSLDLDAWASNDDAADLISAIRENSFDDVVKLPVVQVERLIAADLDEDIKLILDELFIEGEIVSGAAYYGKEVPERERIKNSFKKIFVSHLNRKELTSAEEGVLSAAIPMILWHIQGKSFAEIVSLRLAYVCQKDAQRAIRAMLKNGSINDSQARSALRDLKARYSPAPFSLPNKSERAYSAFNRDMSVLDVEYDLMVYDTYDYLDKVVSLSLSEPLCAAFDLYFKKSSDKRASAMSNYIRYGTDDVVEIWLLRYGFSFEQIGWLAVHVDRIDEDGIVFKQSVRSLDSAKLSAISRYL